MKSVISLVLAVVFFLLVTGILPPTAFILILLYLAYLIACLLVADIKKEHERLVRENKKHLKK